MRAGRRFFSPAVALSKFGIGYARPTQVTPFMSQVLSRSRPAEPAAVELVNAEALSAEIAALAEAYRGREADLRVELAQRLKRALQEGRQRAEQLLLVEGSGRACAERLSRLMDTIVEIAFKFAASALYRSGDPSSSERMAVLAVGGYGRGMLAPGSDIDLLFLLPYKQTAWGESVAEAILYCLWDMGLKVGHATRTVSECIRQAKADMTVRTALLETRYLFGDKKLFNELTTRFDKEVAQG